MLAGLRARLGGWPMSRWGWPASTACAWPVAGPGGRSMWPGRGEIADGGGGLVEGGSRRAGPGGGRRKWPGVGLRSPGDAHHPPTYACFPFYPF